MRTWLNGLILASMMWAQGAAAETVLVVGDSISAAFGLEIEQGWVSLLEKRLARQDESHDVINASISGDTTAGGLSRLPRLLAEHDPDVVVLELGGNDGLRGQPPLQMKQNLAAMIERSRDSGAEVVLLGMRMPPNLGARYTEAYAEAFDSLAEEADVAYVPFFLEGVGGVPGLMQHDGVHPMAQAQERLLDNAWEALEPLL